MGQKQRVVGLPQASSAARLCEAPWQRVHGMVVLVVALLMHSLVLS